MPKVRNAPVQETSYVPDLSMNISKRVSHFLDWAAINRPKEWIPPNEILKYVMGYSKMPRVKSDEVELICKSITRARKYEHDLYNRGLISKTGVGYRATVDALDRTINDLSKRARDLDRAGIRFKETHVSIDPAQIPASGELWKKWLVGGARDLVRQLSDPAFGRKLLPPPVAPVAVPDEKKKP